MSNRTKKHAIALKAGDVVLSGEERLTVKDVQATPGFVIVDFTDGTATAPLNTRTWMWVEAPAPRLTNAERSIIRERAVIAVLNRDTRTATQVARDALGEARWDALPCEDVPAALKAVDQGREIGRVERSLMHRAARVRRKMGD